jgi:hypothetical protein
VVIRDQGYLTYGADGTMQIILDRKDRELPERPGSTGAAGIFSLPPEEQLRAVQGFGAYAGTYTLDGDIVTHHIQFSLNPRAKGTEVQRSVQLLEDGKLLISTRNVGFTEADLLWERVGVPQHA